MSAPAKTSAYFEEAERQRKRQEWTWRAIVVGLILWGISASSDFRWEAISESLPFLLKGFGVSWLLAIISIVAGAVIAVPLAAARVYGPAGIRHLAVAMIEVVRATPELMVVFWVFFGVPALTGASVTAWYAAVIAMTLISAAYLAEVFRGGLYSVAQGQWEGARSTGLNNLQAFIYIIFPQAIKNMVPALIGQLVMLFKTTSLVYVIGVIEFFRATVIVNNAVFAPYALYTLLAVGYFICCWALSLVIQALNPKYTVMD